MRTVPAAVASLLLTACLAVPVPDAAPPPHGDQDAQISAMLQELEKIQSLSPRDKRAVNALLGGGGGGNFLSELNKGPTYSELLGQNGGGGGFNKLGLFSSVLGSSSGSAAGGDSGDGSGGSGGSDSGSILGLITPLLGSSSGSLPADLPEGEGDAAAEGTELIPEILSATGGGSAQNDTGTGEPTEVSEVSAASSSGGGGGGGGASVGASVSLGGGSEDGGDVGASVGASASIGGDGDDSSSAGGAAGAGGSDSGSILSLVTPLLGSSSQGSAGDGSSSGSGNNPVGAGLFGGDFIGSILSTVFMIKSFFFRKIVQLLTSSSGGQSG